jgi:hypothetical protein
MGSEPDGQPEQVPERVVLDKSRRKRAVSGKGEVVLQEASSSILQIVRTKHFETTGRRGGGPTQEELMQRGEERRKSVKGLREKARRMTADFIGDLARGAGLGTVEPWGCHNSGSEGGQSCRVVEKSREREF